MPERLAVGGMGLLTFPFLIPASGDAEDPAPKSEDSLPICFGGSLVHPAYGWVFERGHIRMR